jgi:hypothetical protein
MLLDTANLSCNYSDDKTTVIALYLEIIRINNKKERE